MKSVPSGAISTGLVELDAQDHVVDINAVLADWLGVRADSVTGAPFDSVVRVVPSTGAVNEEYFAGLREIEHSSGARRPVFISRGDPDSAGRSWVTVFDATTQRDLRERLRNRHGLGERTQKRLELVIAASIAFAETSNETELAEVLATTTAEAYAAEESVVFLLGDDQGFRQVAGTNPFVGVGDLGLLTRRATELRTVLKISGIEDARRVAPAVADAFTTAGVQAMIIVPIHQGDLLLGILAAFFHHPRQFDDQASPLADALAGQAARALTALRLQRRLEHAAMHDGTTGLPNRRLLEENIIGLRRTVGGALAVLFVDLDGFKNVNDQLGHEIGDDVLREVAARLRSTVREQDVVTRYGGDEFVIVCEVVDEAAALEMAERVRRSVAEPYEMLPAHLRMSASIGVSVAPTESVSLVRDGLVRGADQAMYRAKFAGGDRVAPASG